MSFITKIERQRPDLETEEELIAWYAANRSAIVKAADHALESTDIKGEQRLQATKSKMQALGLLARFGVEGGTERFRAFNEALVKAGSKELSVQARANLLVLNLQDALEAEGDDKAAKVVTQIKEFASQDKKAVDRAQLAVQAAQILEQASKIASARALYEFIGQTYSDHPDVSETATQLAESASKRLNMLGNELELSGTTVDGHPFDWSKYKGKVVLVDFWATWCGPCVEEMPNVLKNYKKYHDKGFDVVGISADEDKDALEDFVKDQKLPWKNLYDQAASTKMADKYGIVAYPTTALVGRDGKVIKLNVRGEELGEELAKLFGDQVGSK